MYKRRKYSIISNTYLYVITNKRLFSIIQYTKKDGKGFLFCSHLFINLHKGLQSFALDTNKPYKKSYVSTKYYIYFTSLHYVS